MVDQIASTLSYNKGVILPTYADEIPYIYISQVYISQLTETLSQDFCILVENSEVYDERTMMYF